jgi:hypothetical protein
LLDGPCERRERIVQALVLEGLDALQDLQFCLCQARAKFVQAFQLAEFLLTGFRFSLSAQSDTEIVVRFFEIRLERNGALKSGDRSGQIVAGLQFHAEVILRLGILRIELDRLAKLRERAGMIAVAAQRGS